MGEYFTKKEPVTGEIEVLCKVGVMDAWRYVRRSECQAWLPYDAKEETDVLEALQAPSTLYRFPFPDEDSSDTFSSFNWQAIGERDCDRTIKFTYETRDIVHGEIATSLVPTTNSCNFNFWLPCPIITPYPLRKSRGNPNALCTILGERYDKRGNARTIFSCSWCKEPFSVGYKEISEVRQAIVAGKPKNRESDFSSWWDKVADRIKPNRISS